MIRVRSPFSLFFVALSSLSGALVGCANEADDASSNESDVRVQPVGSAQGQNSAPTVTMNLPSGLTANDLAKCDKQGADRWDDGLEFRVNDNISSAPGTWSVLPGMTYLNTRWCSNWGSRSSSLQTEMGKTYSVDLTAFSLNYDMNDLYSSGVSTLNGSEFYIPRGSMKGWLATLPGEVNLKFGIMDGLRVEGKGGVKYALNTSNFDERQGVRIKTPVRELPNCKDTFYRVFAVRARASEKLGSVLRQVSDSWGKTGDTVALGYNPTVWGVAYDASKTPVPNTVAYRLTIAADEYAWNPPGVDLPMSQVGQPPIDFEIGRIDVDDVKYTLPNGQVQTIRGTYQISRITASNQTEAPFIECSTNTGFDVLPGKYKVVVAYDANGKQITESIVDVP